MATYEGKDFTSFRNVNLRGTNTERGSVRSEENGEEGVVKLTIKDGTAPISGTFAIQIPAIAATTSVTSTIATVAGIRAEDGLTVSLQGGTSAGYGTTTTAKILYSAIPGNGSITLNFVNLGAATGYTEHVIAYTAVR